MLDMDELVHEADCLAQALRELLSGTTHAGQEAQKYLVGELASRVSIIRKLWGNSLRPRAAAAYFLSEGRGCLQRHLHVLWQTE